MNPADLALENAISLEATKAALAQRQSGDWKVSFTVQGADMDARLTKAAMGTRFVMVLVEIGDDELPVKKEARAEPRPSARPTPPTDGAARGKMDWRDVQPSAQAALRCEQPPFWAFLREVHGYVTVHDTEGAASAVRHLCVAKSRSEFSTDQRKRVLWKQLDDQFQAWKVTEHA